MPRRWCFHSQFREQRQPITTRFALGKFQPGLLARHGAFEHLKDGFIGNRCLVPGGECVSAPGHGFKQGDLPGSTIRTESAMNPRHQPGLVEIGEQLHLSQAAKTLQRQLQMKQGRAATDHKFTTVGINRLRHRAGIGGQFNMVIVQTELPRLPLVHRGGHAGALHRHARASAGRNRPPENPICHHPNMCSRS